MAGHFINRCFSLIPKTSCQFRTTPLSWPTLSATCSSTHSIIRTRGFATMTSDSGSNHEVKKDINMQSTYQMTSINPTPFNTLSMVKELQRSGFTNEQAQGLVRVLLGVAVYSSEQALSGHVSHSTIDLMELRLKGQIDSLRSEQILLEKGTIGRIQDKTEAIGAQTQRLHDQIKEEVSKVQAGVQLDINLERSRNKENEALFEQKIKDAHHQIDNEVAVLRTTIETQKLEFVKYLAGGIVTLVTLLISVLLGVFRLWK